MSEPSEARQTRAEERAVPARMPHTMMRLRLIVAVLCVMSVAHAQKEESSEVNLVVGGQKVINAVGVQSYSEGAPGIVQIKVPEDGKRMVITAVRSGSTTLLLIYGNNKQETIVINVFARSPQAIRAELKTLLAGLTGVDIREVGGRVFLDGAVPSQEDLARIERITGMYGGQVASFVTVDPARQRTNIKLDLHFVQFRKNSSYKFGLNWPSNIGSHQNAQGSPSVNFLYTYDFLARAATQGQIVIAENLLPSLDILGIRGWAKINNVVSVITTNGGMANYHTGGEVNIRIATSLGNSTLQKIPFGVVLHVQPRLDPQSGLIVVTIDAEQSQLTPITGQDVPGRILTQTKTNVHLKIGQSIMLSGFKQQTESMNATGIPGFMRIPILGYLFRSEAGTSEDTENVLFITPTVIEHTSPDNQQRIEDALKRYDKFGGKVVY
jgi:pilus assembly protein CpaC